MITRVAKVIVPVADQQAALDFWTTAWVSNWYATTLTATSGGSRSAADQDLLLVLSPRQPDEPRRTVPDRLPHSDLFFDCDDIENTYAELSARGEVRAAASASAFRLVGSVRRQRGHPVRTGAMEEHAPQVVP